MRYQAALHSVFTLTSEIHAYPLACNSKIEPQDERFRRYRPASMRGLMTRSPEVMPRASARPPFSSST